MGEESQVTRCEEIIKQTRDLRREIESLSHKDFTTYCIITNKIDKISEVAGKIKDEDIRNLKSRADKMKKIDDKVRQLENLMRARGGISGKAF